MVVCLLLLASAAPRAGAGERLQYGCFKAEYENFFDWKWTTLMWRDLPDFGALMARYGECRAAYEPWRTDYLENGDYAVRALQSNPQAGAIRQCHDLQLAHEWWEGCVYDDLVRAFRRTKGKMYTFEEIVENHRGYRCNNAADFKELDCYGKPDWRTDAQKAADQAMYAEFPEGRAKHLEWVRKREERKRELSGPSPF